MIELGVWKIKWMEAEKIHISEFKKNILLTEDRRQAMRLPSVYYCFTTEEPQSGHYVLPFYVSTKYLLN